MGELYAAAFNKGNWFVRIRGNCNLEDTVYSFDLNQAEILLNGANA
ncbi:hypothetical protein RAHE111665_04640 [Rariglobus hedericola]